MSDIVIVSCEDELRFSAVSTNSWNGCSGGGNRGGQSERRSLDSVGGKNKRQGGGGSRDSASGQTLAQLVERARNPLLSGVVTHAERQARRSQILVFEESHHQCVIVALIQLGHRPVQDRMQAFPVRRSF